MLKRIPLIFITAGLVLLLALSSCAPAIPSDVAFYETASAMYWERDASHLIAMQDRLMKYTRLIFEGTVTEVHHYTLAYNEDRKTDGIKGVNYCTIYTFDINEFIINEDNYKKDTVKIVTMHFGKPKLSGEYELYEGEEYIVIADPFSGVSRKHPDINSLFDSKYHTGTGQGVFQVDEDENVNATRTVLYNSYPNEETQDESVIFDEPIIPVTEQNKSEFYIERFKVDRDAFISHLKKLYEKFGGIATE